MRSKLGIVFMTMGAALILAALSLLLWNRWEDSQAGKAARQVVAQLEEQVPVAVPTRPAPEVFQPTAPLDPVMKEVEIDGHAYIGYVSIPAFERKLPVMSQWSYPQLKIAPCRYTGSLVTDDLVIMAHNFEHHFGQIKTLSPGDQVQFTDMEGNVTLYQVMGVETLNPQAIEEMTAGEYDLTLFTCTYGGESRVTVRCDRAES